MVALALQYVRRIEVNDRGIAIYSFFNRKTFQASWSEVTALTRTMRKEGAPESWKIETTAAHGFVPNNVEHYADLMRFIVKAIPPEARPVIDSGLHRGNPADVEPVVHRGGSTRNTIFAAGFFASVLGSTYMAWMFLLLLPNRATAANAFPATILLLTSAAIPMPFFLQGFRGTLKRASSLNESGIHEDDAFADREVGWNDIVFAEVRSYLSLFGPCTELVAASPWHSIVIDRSEKTYREAMYGVCQLSPPTALVIPPASFD